jgi:branched-chain amino acid transport system ATP-binding protein
MAYFEGKAMTGGYGSGPDIINSCTVNVNKGEIVSILGPNGAGKSTAMKAMLGLAEFKSWVSSDRRQRYLKIITTR